jgi:hypothetical protein
MSEVVVGALIGVGGVVLGYVAQPILDRALSRAQWQRGAIVDLVNALTDVDATSHAMLNAVLLKDDPGFSAARIKFRLAVAELEARIALILDDELEGLAHRYRMIGVRLANDPAPADTHAVLNALREDREALLQRARSVLRRLG